MIPDIDALGLHLTQLGKFARSMPPSWEGAGDRIPLCTNTGIEYGTLLPGRGVFLYSDLRDYGIRRGIPHVYEMTIVRRLYDILGDNRGTLASYDDFINGRELMSYFTKSTAACATSAWHSLLSNGGAPPAVSYTAIPGGAVHTMDSTGAWNLNHTPLSGSKRYLVELRVYSDHFIGGLMFIDLLVAAGSILPTVDTAQTINTTALTRHTTGNGVMMILEVTTAHGSTAANVTINKYTNQAGTTNQTTGAFTVTTSAIAKRLLPIALGPFIQLASGDYGVRSVEEITYSAANSAGVDALLLYKPLTMMAHPGGSVDVEREFTGNIDGCVEMTLDGSGVPGSLGALWLAPSIDTNMSLSGLIRTVDG